MKKNLFYFLMVGLAFTVLQVATVEANIGVDHPCYDIAPAERDGHACWNSGGSGGACDSNPACDPSDPAGNCCPTCDPNPACVIGDPNAKPCCGTGATMAPPAGNGMNRMPGAAPMAPPGDGGGQEDCMDHPAGPARAACEARGGTDGGGQEDCMDHPAGPARAACEARGGTDGGGQEDCMHHPAGPARAACEADDAHGTNGEDCAGKETPALVAACWDKKKAEHADDGHHGGMAPGTVALTIGDPKCVVAPELRDPGCPNFGGGDHHDGPPPIDPRSGKPFTPGDEATYQKYVDECEATKGVLSEGSIAELIIPPHNFTRVQVEKLCKDGAEHEHPAP